MPGGRRPRTAAGIVVFLLVISLALQQDATAQPTCDSFKSGTTSQDTIFVTEDALSQTGNDVQFFVDCAESNDVILFGVQTVEVASTVVVDKPLSLKSADGLEAQFVCPPEGTVFDIRAQGVVLEGMAFSDCTLGGSDPLVLVSNCLSQDPPIRMTELLFRANTNANNGTAGIGISSGCQVELESSTFQENTGAAGAAVGVASGARVLMSNLTFEGNTAPNQGGAANSLDANLSTSDGDLDGNLTDPDGSRVESFGGAVSAQGGAELQMDGCMFSNNSAAVGGALFVNDNVVVSITSCTFVDNSALDGGALYAQASVAIDIAQCAFTANKGEFGGALYAKDDVEVDVSDCTFSEGSASWGGAVYAEFDVRIGIASCGFANNDAISFGGALFARDNVVADIQSCTFENNEADEHGGALHMKVAVTADVLDSTFVGNDADIGGALYAEENVTTNIRNCTFARNTAKSGGALYAWNIVTADATSSSFSDNSASFGGAVFMQGTTTLTASDCTFDGNQADVEGGAMYAQENVTVDSTDCMFTLNKAVLGGGALFARGRVGYSSGGCTYDQNEASRDGGAFFVKENGIIESQNCTFSQNRAERGGAVYAEEDTRLASTDTNFLQNRAVTDGGALYAQENTTATSRGCTFSGNSADMRGGALFAQENVTLDITDCTFDQNQAVTDGGAVFALNDATTGFTNSIFTANNASRAGGALYTQGSGVEVDACNFQNNSAVLGGGAIAVEGSEDGNSLYRVVIRGARFNMNTVGVAPGDMQWGGALFLGSFPDADSVTQRGRVTCDLALATFERNTAGNGGAVAATPAVLLSMENVLFLNNSGVLGGAVHLQWVVDTEPVMFQAPANYVNGTRLEFRDNYAAQGGALHFRRSCSPDLLGAGGCTSVGIEPRSISLVLPDGTKNNADDVFFESSTFTSNNAAESGGALHVEMGNVGCLDCSFSNNIVTSGNGIGGAVCLLNQSAFHGRQGSLDSNSAANGGGVYGNRSVLDIVGSVVANNVASEYGGGIHIRSPLTGGFDFGVAGHIGNSTLSGNRALVGGALSFFAEGNANGLESNFLSLAESLLIDNVAERAGGGLFTNVAETVDISCDFPLDSTEDTNPDRSMPPASDRQPGVLSATRSSPDGITSASDPCPSWTGNVAEIEEGGDATALTATSAQVCGSFIGSCVSDGDTFRIEGHISGENLMPFTVLLVDPFDRPVYGQPDMMVVIAPEDPGDVDIALSGQLSAEAGAATVFDRIRLSAPSGQVHRFTISFEPSTLQNITMEVEVQECLQAGGCAVSPSQDFPDLGSAAQNSTLQDQNSTAENTADPGSVAQNATGQDPTALNTTDQDPAALNATGQDPAALNATGQDPAALNATGQDPAALNATGQDPTVLNTTGQDPTVLNTTGQDPQALNTTGQDPTALNTTGQDPTALNATGQDPTTLNATGQNPTVLNATGQNPTALNTTGQNTTGLNATGQDPTALNPTGLDPTALNATGQNTTDQGSTDGLITFQVPEGCMICPDNARCGPSTTTPEEGFWHPTSQSSQVRACINRQACELGIRRGELTANASGAHGRGATLPFSSAEYQQCAEGYHGILCGACDGAYTKAPSDGKCHICSSRGRDEFILVISFLWLVFLAAFVLYKALSFLQAGPVAQSTETGSNRDAVIATRLVAIEQGNGSGPSSPCGEWGHPQPVGEGSSSRAHSEEHTEVFSVGNGIDPADENEINEAVMGMAMENGADPSGGSLEEHRPVGTPISPVTDRGPVLLKDVKKDSVSEVLKILLNFLQTMSIGFLINVNWSDIVSKTLGIADFLAGGSGGAVFDKNAFLACLVDTSRDSGRHLSVVAFFSWLPFILIAAINMFWVLRAYWRLDLPEDKKPYILRRWAVTAYSVFYMAYIEMTTSAMRIFWCVRVDLEDGSETSRYWAEHTDVKCHVGNHMSLVMGAGIFLILAVVGMPFWLLIVLMTKRDAGGQVYAPTYGFLYSSYRMEREYWEVVVLLRKALLFMIAAFGRSLRIDVQAVLVMAILLFSLGLHVLNAPYVEDPPGSHAFKNIMSLNNLELLSLWTLVLFFFGGIILNDPGTAQWARSIVSLVVMVAVLGTLVVIAHQFWLQTKLTLSRKSIAFVETRIRNVKDGLYSLTRQTSIAPSPRH